MVKKIALVLLWLLVPGVVLAGISVPWNRVQVGTESPLYPNDGILVQASSTINSTLSVSSLSSGNCVQASLGGLLTTVVSPCGSGSGTVTSVGLATPNSTLSLGGTNPVTSSGTINADLNLSHSNIWTVLQTFNGNASTTQISSTGNTYLATSGGSVGIATTSPPAVLGLHGNFFVDNGGGGKYSWIGTPMTAAGADLAQGSDVFVVGTTTAITSRGALVVNNYTGPASASAVAQGINGIEILGSKSTGSLTFTTTSGGSLRSRYLVNNLSAGYGVSQMSAVSASAEVQGTLASSTDAAEFNAELPVVNSGDLITNFYGLRVNGGAVTGTLTNNYGVKVENMVGGTNRWAFYQAGTADNNYFAGFVGLGTTTPDAQYAQLAASSTVNFAGVHDIFGVISGITYLFERIDGFMHLITSGPVPALSSCGTSTVSGNDRNGTVTLNGIALTSCTMTFARAYNTAPDCTVSDNTTASTADLDTTATTVTFGLSVGLNSGKLFYQCAGHQ